MSITVEMLRHGMANVITTPSLIRRMLFRESETQRIAVCVCGRNGWLWIWDDGKGVVADSIVKLIDRAATEARRRALAEANLGNVHFLEVARDSSD